MPCSISKEIFGQYDKLIFSMQEKITLLYRKWISSTGEDISSRLNRSLMCRSHTKPGLIECNIDRSLLKIFKETKYFNEGLDFEIPFHVKAVYSKAETIQSVYESVLSVVLNYNQVISSLSDDERLLFKPLINNVERKIAPGLSKLTWSTDVVDEYIAECSQHTAELQDFVDDYKSCNLKIIGICEKICDTLLINITPNYNFELEELVDFMKTFMTDQLALLTKMFQEIIQFLIVVFEGFEYNIQQMADQWIKYINNFDILFQEALKMCCKNSLTNIYEIFHGDDNLGPTPILKLYLSLNENKISFEPPISKVAHVIANVHHTMVQGLKDIPRLNDKFHVALIDTPSFSTVIEMDVDCCELQNKLNEEVMKNINAIREYLQLWEPFKNLWEVDKDKFMTRYASQRPTATLFDSNLQRYTEVANSVQIQESVAAVHAVLINCDDLKKSIMEHIDEWQNRNAQLLIQMTNDSLQHIYNYVTTNSEQIMKKPTNLQEMQDAIRLYDKLKNEIPILEEMFPTIKEKIDVLDKYLIPVSDEIRAGPTRISLVWAEYLEVLSQAEKMLNYSKDNFKKILLEQTEVLRQEDAAMLQDFLAHGPFSSEWTPKQALGYIADLKEQLRIMKEKEAELRANLAVFGLSLPENEELKKLENELMALEVVWQLADEWDTAWDKYKSGEFWEIETEEMEETAQGLYRKLTKLSGQLKEKNWTIVEDTRARVDAFRRTLPLIGDLKNPAMRSRHWDKVREAVGIDFDETSKEFNLEAIYSMQMHLYSEEIADVSNAATMELQIEKGLKAIGDFWRTMLLEMVPYKDMGIYR
ncbi:unnamed protein product [Brassicogethes aeneus]|uniref:Dynein heavy chain linker domain-containing protein n=1 Tax=Brassicogethes aeneus TaxID=1431903 RepID=A0A9P0FHC3_BRAAE|nr:unnamed protein product [Brassicogethes aeneus]